MSGSEILTIVIVGAAALLVVLGVIAGRAGRWPLRIRKTRWKLVYIVVGTGLLAGIAHLLAPLLEVTSAAVLGDILFLLFSLGGARAFRGRGEPIEPPRAWWRMTSRPTAGLVLGGLLTLSLAQSVYGAFTESAGMLSRTVPDAILVAVLAGLYVNSSVRLLRRRAVAVAAVDAVDQETPRLAGQSG